MIGGYLLRVCHAKTGRLRYLSHLELVRALERSVRRAGLPFAVSHGFSPHMRLAFGPALPVGTAGLAEWLDVHMTAFVPPDEAMAALSAATPPEIAPVRLAYVVPDSRSLSAALTAARYEVTVEGVEDAGALRQGIAATVAAGSLDVAHKGKKRTYDLAGIIWEHPQVVACERGLLVRLGLRLGERGTLRPEALVRAALEYSGGQDPALSVTRTSLLQERGAVFADPLD